MRATAPSTSTPTPSRGRHHGQLFANCNVALGEDHMGSVKADSPITVYGRQVAGDPIDLRLRSDQQIVLDVT